MNEKKPTDIGAVYRPASAAGPASNEGLDRNAMLAAVGDDAMLLQELIELFLATCPALLHDVRRAVDARDGPALGRAAHKLKGAAGSIRVEALQAAALALEVLGQSGDLEQAPAACTALENTAVRLLPALARLLNEGG